MTNEEKKIILENQIDYIYKELKRVGNYSPESLKNYSRALINLKYLAEELALKIADEESKKRFRQYFEDSLLGEECEEVNENE